MAGAASRVKLRVRTYPPLRTDSTFILEVKRKETDAIIKHRSSVSREDVLELVAGTYGGVLSRHPGDAAVEDFIYHKTVKGMDLAFVVEYVREAFVNRHNSRYVRVSIDSELCFFGPEGFLLASGDPGRRYPEDSAAICEIKFDGTAPFWLPYLVQKYDLQVSPYSKFAAGIDSAWGDISFESPAHSGVSSVDFGEVR